LQKGRGTWGECETGKWREGVSQEETAKDAHGREGKGKDRNKKQPSTIPAGCIELYKSQPQGLEKSSSLFLSL
jgi:hypothetical protein